MKQRKFGPYIAAGVTAFAVIAAAILMFFLIYHISAVKALLDTLAYILRPIFYGLVLAFLLLPIQRGIYEFLLEWLKGVWVNWPRKNGMLRFVSILLSLAFAVLVVYILLAMVLPQLYSSIVGLVNAFPGYIDSVQQWLTDFFQDNPDLQEAVLPYYNSASESLEKWFTENGLLSNFQSADATMEWLQTELFPRLTGVFTSVYAGLWALVMLLKDLLIAVIVSVYVLVRKDKFAAQTKKITYSIFSTRIADFLVEETRSLSGFINGKLLDSLIIGIIALVCCNLLKFPYPMLLAVIIGVTNVIPFFGPFIGAIPCALLILLVSPLQCVYFCIFVLILQQFDGNILGPKILGDSTGLDSFWVLFSILLFGGLFGFAGMVLGVPVFAMFYSVISRLVRFGLRKKSLPEDTAVYLGKTGPMAKKKE